MAKRKKALPWDVVYDQIQVRHNRHKPRHSDYVYPAPVTDVELNELESRLGCKLPESYRVFMKRFGPGEVADFLSFFPPSVRDEGSQTLIANTTAYRNLFQNREGLLSNAAWLSRLVFFGSDVCADSYAWDTKDITCTDPTEYRIYRIRRMQEGDPENLGGTLAELIEGAWEEKLRLLEEDGEERPTGIDFEPWGALRKKVKPNRSEVQLWLAFNSYAVRDLALSIRDSKQPDGFPILADALQEAGCTNLDLLNSCRTGDPAFDGRWALRILLGKK